MKMRRRTGVNGVRENHRDTVVNQGGTAESFRSLIGKEGSAFLRKNTGQDTSQKKQKQRRKKRRTLWQKKKNW